MTSASNECDSAAILGAHILPTSWWNFEYGKMEKIWFLFARPLKIIFFQNCSTEFLDIALKSPWACVIKVCSNGAATYIILEKIARDNLNVSNLM